MSKTEKVNKSEMIRQQLKSMKPSERSPKAVAAALKAKGVEVSPGLVGIVKMKMKPKKGKAKIKAKSKRKSVRSATSKAWKTRRKNSWKSWEDLLQSTEMAKNFIRSTGGVKQAKHVLDIVSKIVS
jgi:hypothetical protein